MMCKVLHTFINPKQDHKTYLVFEEEGLPALTCYYFLRDIYSLYHIINPKGQTAVTINPRLAEIYFPEQLINSKLPRGLDIVKMPYKEMIKYRLLIEFCMTNFN